MGLQSTLLMKMSRDVSRMVRKMILFLPLSYILLSLVKLTEFSKDVWDVLSQKYKKVLFYQEIFAPEVS